MHSIHISQSHHLCCLAMTPNLLLALIALLLFSSIGLPMSDVVEADPLSALRVSCATVRYPKVCFTSLSPLASTFFPDPVHLATAALNATLVHAIYVAGIVKSMPSSPASKDCIEVMVSAVDELKKSMKVMMHVGGQDLGEQIDDMQTWASAALTNENTCIEGFHGMHDDNWVVTRARIIEVAQLTSNALGFINALVKHQSTTPFT